MITKMEALEAIIETWNKYKNIDHDYFTTDDIHVADEILDDVYRELEVPYLEDDVNIAIKVKDD